MLGYHMMYEHSNPKFIVLQNILSTWNLVSVSAFCNALQIYKLSMQSVFHSFFTVVLMIKLKLFVNLQWEREKKAISALLGWQTYKNCWLSYEMTACEDTDDTWV